MIPLALGLVLWKGLPLWVSYLLAGCLDGFDRRESLFTRIVDALREMSGMVAGMTFFLLFSLAYFMLPLLVDRPWYESHERRAQQGQSAVIDLSLLDRDDPNTSNDESNDQPLGHFGSMTLWVRNVNSGNSYPLDAEVSGISLERFYFSKGGWVDFYSCELDENYSGTCEDENGTEWEIEGKH